jgi:hypothetical protein
MVCVTRCSTFRRLLHTHIHILNDTLNTCVRDDDTIRRLLHARTQCIMSQGVIQSVVCCTHCHKAWSNPSFVARNVTRRDPIRRLLHARTHQQRHKTWSNPSFVARIHTRNRHRERYEQSNRWRSRVRDPIIAIEEREERAVWFKGNSSSQHTHTNEHSHTQIRDWHTHTRILAVCVSMISECVWVVDGWDWTGRMRESSPDLSVCLCQTERECVFSLALLFKIIDQQHTHNNKVDR